MRLAHLQRANFADAEGRRRGHQALLRGGSAAEFGLRRTVRCFGAVPVTPRIYRESSKAVTRRWFPLAGSLVREPCREPRREPCRERRHVAKANPPQTGERDDCRPPRS